MTDFVKDHALANIWCTPDHDRLVVIKPTKISEPVGSFRRLRVMWESVELPTPDGYYYVYQIGQVPPELYNLPTTTKDQWLAAADFVDDQKMIIRIYSATGETYPLSQVFFRIGHDNNIIFAVKKIRDFPLNLDTTDIFVQFYSNMFYNSFRWQDMLTAANKPLTQGIQYSYRKLTNVQDINAFRQDVLDKLSNSLCTPDRVIYYVNGRFCIGLLQTQDFTIGTHVEAYIDSSIKSIRTVANIDFGSFTSIRDAEMKRLFPPVKSVETIDYRDDVDFHIAVRLTPTKLVDGLFFNQNDETSVRMVTHNSYALSDLQLQAMMSADTVIPNESVTEVVAIVRHAGYKRPLLNEHHRLSELYKLSELEIRNSLLGIDSTIPEWRADVLENSDYMNIVSGWSEDITDAMVEDAYGYNLITKLFAYPYPPLEVMAGNKYVSRPLGLRRATLTTYDVNGKLITTGNGNIGGLQPLPAPSTNVALVELSPGELTAANEASRWVGVPVIHAPEVLSKIGFRCYVCPIVSGLPNHEWIDVTNEDYFTISPDGKTLTWNMTILGSLNYYPATVIGTEVIWYKVPLSLAYHGSIRFTINAKQYRSFIYPPGPSDVPVLENTLLSIPTGVLEIFMDGEALIENIDYYAEYLGALGTQVVIVKRPLRTPAGGLDVHVRAYGFCNEDLSRDPPRETGFVIDGYLSADEVREIRNDRNYRIVVGGSVKRSDQVRFSEDGATAVGVVENGKPYSITDIVMPVEWFTSKETIAYRAISEDVDARVGQYMTTKDAGLPPAALNPITNKYDLYSPFLSRLIHKFINGNWLVNGELDGPYDNVDVAGWVASETYLLPYDPCLKEDLKTEYLHIRPHQYDNVITLTAVQYTFLETIIRDYLRIPTQPDRVDLSPYVTIG